MHSAQYGTAYFGINDLCQQSADRIGLLIHPQHAN